MASPHPISKQLELYMHSLGKISREWQEWLAAVERSTVDTASNQSPDLQLASQELFQQIQQLVATREALIAQARDLGWQANTLRSVAQHLPIWNNPSFRTAFEAAKLHLSQLRRHHIAAWLVVRESADYCQDTILLMMSGKTRSDFTIDNLPAEAGGHLLDASL